ncbi:MAG: malto-oligosyltrehalose trehalohydrolase [Candidatus Binatia bacterium]
MKANTPQVGVQRHKKTVSSSSPASFQRRLPIGAEVVAGGEVHFRVWAPYSRTVEVITEHHTLNVIELDPESNGYFSARSSLTKAGDVYRYRLDGSPTLVADPASRFQPEGPLGPSMIIDPAQFLWHDADWNGLKIEGQVIYEMHSGTFTTEGTWNTARQQLAPLRDLGVTVLEIMPVHDFCGRYGWGYDGVNFFAPTRLYGTADDFRSFVDSAHGLGLGVILDVVYNHAGPTGNYLRTFSPDYFTDRYSTDWGEAFNFDGPNAAPVREFFISNAGYWIDEFHLDGLRLDATQNIYDASAVHVLAEITARVRRAARGRSTIVVAENEPQEARLVRSVESGGYGMDGIWNDDFHHSAMVALTGHNEAYYSDHRGRPQEFISAAKRGFLYQGQYYSWQQQRRGTWTGGLKPAAFIHFLQNHDQVANFGRGERIHQTAHPGVYRAMTALFLLSPQTPMLFQGQEFAASSPFAFFADHDSELGSKVKEGRFEFLSQFPSLASPYMQKHLPDPTDPRTFESCRLDLSERERHPEAYLLHRDLLNLRRNDPVIKDPRPGAVDGAVLADDAFVLRFFGVDGNDRLLLINLGVDCSLSPTPEPLLASPAGLTWRLLWSSEDPRYGGHGAAPIEDEMRWFLPGKAAFLLNATNS